MEDKIRQYWDDRAKQDGAVTSTTNDIFLRELEIKALVTALGEKSISNDSTWLDIGCGDGYSTIRVTEALGLEHTIGVDFSPEMIRRANTNLGAHPQLRGRLRFLVADVLDLATQVDANTIDYATTDRCLINLTSSGEQKSAIRQIANCLKLGGWYVGIENFIEGHRNLNEQRKAVGLSEIPVRWHNLFFSEKKFVTQVSAHFTHLESKDFSSSYYYATRVIYSKMCQLRGEEPDYTHEIHQLAVGLPPLGQFSPVRLFTLRKK